MASKVPDETKNIRDNLLCALECPVCFIVMRPPIFQCKNGHTICSKCKSSLRECYTCRDGAMDTRSLIAEKMAATITYPCINKQYGCDETSPLDQIWRHETVCPYREYQCLIGKDEKPVQPCGWKGRKTELLPHVKQKHSAFVYLKEELVVSGLIHDLNTPFFSCDLMAVHDEIFWLHRKRDPVEGKYYQAVQYIGPHHNAKKFTYTHAFSTNTGDQTIVFKNTPCLDTEEIEGVYHSGRCLLLDFVTIKYHIFDKNSLSYLIRIEKTNSST